MKEHEIDLTVGEALHIAGYTVTVVDIEGAAIGVRIDSVAEEDETFVTAPTEFASPPR